VLDLVESVRLMEADEARVVQAWGELSAHAEKDILTRYPGRVVKSLGDGLLAQFDRATDAVAAALAFHRFMRRLSAPLPAEVQMLLRAGLHATHLYEGERDVYGSGVNLAARVAGLAKPGETVVTAEVRDQIVDGMDADARRTSRLECRGVCSRLHLGNSATADDGLGWSGA
jgi:class 3 adenylate cyclase